jgi:hypothetical protein
VRTRKLEKSKDILLREEPSVVPIKYKETILIPIMQSLSKQKGKPLPIYTVPDQIKIQALLRKLTFP